MSTCRYHAFDNTRKDAEDNTQVPELMEKVEELITDNQGLLFKSGDGRARRRLGGRT